jgi:cytochrome c biogenesis protein CcmG, thiol:disulfide interchange protein DsbE
LGILLFAFLTACGVGQEESKQFQAASAQAVVDGERLAIPKSQPDSQFSQPSSPVGQPQPAASSQQTKPSEVEVAQVASAVDQASVKAEPASPAATAAPEAPVAAAPSEPVISDPAPEPIAQVEVRPEVGFQAPDFTLQTLDGQTVRLSDLKGRPVFITYWSTWCAPCKVELPILERIRQELAHSDIQMLTINAIEQDKLESVQGLVGEMGLTMPVLLDNQNQFQSAYNQLFFPTSYFIDPNGVIRFIKLGDASEADLRANIEKLLNNQL